MNIDTPASWYAAIAINGAVGRQVAHALPGYGAIVRIADNIDRERAIAAVGEAFTELELRENPIMLWQGADELLVGPVGVLSPTDLLPGVESLDTRIYRARCTPARVVISWLDGPTREDVARRIAAQPASGLTVELVHEVFDALVGDLVDAAYRASLDEISDVQEIAALEVLARASVIRDEMDLYDELLDLAAALVVALGGCLGQDAFDSLVDAVCVLDDVVADQVADDVDVRVSGGQMFAVRAASDDHTMVTVLFTLVVLLMSAVDPAVRRRVHAEWVGGRRD